MVRSWCNWAAKFLLRHRDWPMLLVSAVAHAQGRFVLAGDVQRLHYHEGIKIVHHIKYMPKLHYIKE